MVVVEENLYPSGEAATHRQQLKGTTFRLSIDSRCGYVNVEGLEMERRLDVSVSAGRRQGPKNPNPTPRARVLLRLLRFAGARVFAST